MQKRVELLSPAGSLDAAKAALANGADALYLGTASFGARSSAGFDPVTLQEVIDLCHLHQRRVHVTLNTLIKENEVADVDQQLQLLSKLKADAILVQDIGLMHYIRRNYPEFELHISTQMALHNAAGARFAIQNGADRIVLARECDLNTIRSVCETGIDTEVFVHGALCVCVSGQCQFSSAIGGRSGNRGRCAQPCRLEYEYLGKKGAWLSPRDICLRDSIPQLLDTGVASLKIEGRLKRPEYVAIVTRAYRNAIDSYYAGSFHPATPEESASLRQIFSRGGFSKGYAFGTEDAGIIYPDRVKPEGSIIGKTGKSNRLNGITLCSVQLTGDLHNGDGLEINDTSVIYSGPDCSACQTVQIRVHDAVSPGKPVRLTEDENQLKQARLTYEGNALDRSAPIRYDLDFTAYPGKQTQVTVRTSAASVSITGPEAENAQHSELNEELIRRSFSKTGGTPFVLHDLICHTKDAFLTSAVLNQLRKDALTKLIRQITDQVSKKNHCFEPENTAISSAQDVPQKPLLYACFDQPDKQAELINAGADRLVYIPDDYDMKTLDHRLSLLNPGVFVALPEVCSDIVLHDTVALIESHRLNIVLRNVSQLSLSVSASVIALDMLPVFNQRTADYLFDKGCSCVTLSHELSLSEIKLLQLSSRFILPVHGRQRLMTLTHCPYRTLLGLTHGHAACRFCHNGQGAEGTYMKDRKGASYPLRPIHSPDGCRIELQDHRIKDLSHLQEQLRSANTSLLIDTTSESISESARVLKVYRAILDGENVSPLSGNYTEGRIRTGVL